MDGDFELNLIQENNEFKCSLIIHFNDNSIIENKDFINYKRLLKYLRIVIKSSVKYHEAMILLEKIKSEINGSE